MNSEHSDISSPLPNQQVSKTENIDRVHLMIKSLFLGATLAVIWPVLPLLPPLLPPLLLAPTLALYTTNQKQQNKTNLKTSCLFEAVSMPPEGAGAFFPAPEPAERPSSIADPCAYCDEAIDSEETKIDFEKKVLSFSNLSSSSSHPGPSPNQAVFLRKCWPRSCRALSQSKDI